LVHCFDAYAHGEYRGLSAMLGDLARKAFCNFHNGAHFRQFSPRVRALARILLNTFMDFAANRNSVDSPMDRVAPLVGSDVNQMVLAHMTTAIMLFDGMSALLDMNQAAEELLGVSLNKVRGLRLQNLFSESELFAAALHRVASNDQAVTEREMRLGVHGLGVITVDCAITPVTKGHKVEAVLVELITLDRHKQITREERLVADTESARQVLRGLAHETMTYVNTRVSSCARRIDCKI
jgi:PAS domain-containing protein